MQNKETKKQRNLETVKKRETERNVETESSDR